MRHQSTMGNEWKSKMGAKRLSLASIRLSFRAHTHTHQLHDKHLSPRHALSSLLFGLYALRRPRRLLHWPNSVVQKLVRYIPGTHTVYTTVHGTTVPCSLTLTAHKLCSAKCKGERIVQMPNDCFIFRCCYCC